ncbi:hypothetical protein CYLTODRAFT_75628 [Cylindrobasidium torrendii FP15055 ss-10]|uniref:Uncharacterized protein n=1 Tax=Cylindrobasidium torrendii FP15055 ss-10 TaxID=1314674 RepID=A0A0D7B6C5_9AGAR|nr:hypothetical protein CYLTODRAFT_75628 [Cylindrobasidium torrendii FP15055 ss-10]
MWIWTAGGLARFIDNEPTRAGRLLRARLVISSATGPGGNCINELPMLRTQRNENVTISATCATATSVKSEVEIADSHTEAWGETRRRLLQGEIRVDMTPYFWASFLRNVQDDIEREKFESRDEYILSLCNAYIYGSDPAHPIDPNAPISLNVAIRSFPQIMARIAATFHDRLEPLQTSPEHEAKDLKPTCDPSLQVYTVECFLLYFFSRLRQTRQNSPQLLGASYTVCSIYPIISELVGLRQRYLFATEQATRDTVDTTSNAQRKAATELLLEIIDDFEDPNLLGLEDLRASLSKAAMSTVETNGFTTKILKLFKHARPSQGCPV